MFGIGYTFIQTSIIRSMDHDDDYDDDEVEDFVDSYINRTDYLKSEKQGINNKQMITKLHHYFLILI